MNAVAKPQLVAGGSPTAIVPTSVDEAYRLAVIFHKSGMVPQSLKTPEQVMVAIMAGAELGMVPFQAVRHIAVVNNRPTLWGDGLVAVARSQGVRISERVEGEGDGIIATCEVTRPDTGEVIVRTFSVADAKKAQLWAKSGPWQQYPKRMLSMRARAFALRDGAADILNGFQVAEEVEDYVQPQREVTPRAEVIHTLQLEAAQPEGTLEIVAEDEPPAPTHEPEAVTVEPEDVLTDPPAEDQDDMFPGDRPMSHER